MKFLRRPEIAPAALLVVAFAICALQSPYFLDVKYLLDSSSLYMEVGIVAIGMTWVIVSGNIDLSVGANLALSACLSAEAISHGASPWVGCAIAICAGMVLGWFNGVLVVKARLPSFVATLATMAIYRGAAQAMLASNSISIPERLVGLDAVKPLGIPGPLILWVVLIAGLGAVLHRTVIGRWIYTIGTNEAAAFYSGVPVARTKVVVFTLTGALCGVAALTMNSRLGVARYDHGMGLELDAIVAVALGGASISGGRGTTLGTAIALTLLGVIRTGMGVADVKAEYQLAVVGALLVFAVVAGNLTGKRARALT